MEAKSATLPTMHCSDLREGEACTHSMWAEMTPNTLAMAPTPNTLASACPIPNLPILQGQCFTSPRQAQTRPASSTTLTNCLVRHYPKSTLAMVRHPSPTLSHSWSPRDSTVNFSHACWLAFARSLRATRINVCLERARGTFKNEPWQAWS